MKTQLVQTDWHTLRVETDGDNTKVTPLETKALERFLERWEITTSETTMAGLKVCGVRRRTNAI